MCDEIESRRIVLRILTVFSQRKQQGKGVAGHGQTLCKGGRPRPHPLHGWLTMAIPLAVARGQATRGGRQWPTRKGQPAATSPIASKGGGADRKGGRPSAGRLSAARGHRCQRRGGGVVKAKRARAVLSHFIKFSKYPQHFLKF
ncbi:hypothetical protein GW17_00059484 [Ensete ventricosum]|nr:hypothetical protein GW17_00059484 [Ensete ventricosum]